MRIDILRIIAVLSLAAIWIPWTTAHSDLTHTRPKSLQRAHSRRDSKLYSWSSGGDGFDREVYRPWLTYQQHLLLLEKEQSREDVFGFECCPSIEEMIEPDGGKTKDDMYVKLFRDGDITQRFYEVSCKEDVLNRPCYFLDRKFHNQSRCVQKYSYTYALVRDPAATPRDDDGQVRHHHHGRAGFTVDGWKMDYIQVRSGCSCEILKKSSKRRTMKNKKNHKNKKIMFHPDET